MNTEMVFEDALHSMRRLYRKNMAGVLVLSAGVLAASMLFPELPSLSKKASLIAKSVMIVLFLSVIPLLLSHLRKQLRLLPAETSIARKMAVYRRQFYIKAAVLSLLCLMSMVVFLASGDPMILVLLLAGVMFLYFERPNRLKIRNDLKMDEES